MGRKIVVAIDSSEHSLLAARWASANLIRNGDDLHLVSICTPPPYTAIPPLATTGCATASFINYEQCRKEDELKIKQLLHDVKSEVFNNFPEQSVHLHIVPGGDVGSCITIWAKEYHADVVVGGKKCLLKLKKKQALTKVDLLTVFGIISSNKQHLVSFPCFFCTYNAGIRISRYGNTERHPHVCCRLGLSLKALHPQPSLCCRRYQTRSP